MKIDFVSDVVCPWCAIGWHSLQQALQRLGPDAKVELHLQPFELNPQMGPEGEDIVQHLSHKYRISAEQIAQNRKAIEERGAAVGFAFGPRERTYNTFDAHRLLQWAGTQGHAAALKAALLQAYHGDGQNVSDHAVLLRVAAGVGLDLAQAWQVLASDAHAAEVREREHFFQQEGVNGVPAVIINDQYLISGAQPVEVFEEALREILQEEGEAT